jgi:large subunit ribosomal protein L23
MPARVEQYSILKRPLVTEKSSRQMESGVYTFEVHLDSNKFQIAQAVRDVFDVNVKKVRTVRVKGCKNKRNRFGYYNEKDWKKAIVTLAKGENIEIT